MRLVVEYDPEELKKMIPDTRSGSLRYLGFRLAAYMLAGEFDNIDALSMKQMGIKKIEIE